jgi:tubulin-specific chaperone A
MAERELKIKTGALKRLHKEYLYYIAERDKQNERINKMIEENADPYDIRKQREVLDDTIQMIPDSQRRMEETLAKVKELLNNPDVKDPELREAAEAAIASIKTNA